MNIQPAYDAMEAAFGEGVQWSVMFVNETSRRRVRLEVRTAHQEVWSYNVQLKTQWEYDLRVAVRKLAEAAGMNIDAVNERLNKLDPVVR
jgi:hypothetical protein